MLLVVPFENDKVELNLAYRDELDSGNYIFMDSDYSGQIYRFSITSSSDIFQESFGEGLDAPEQVNISIINSGNDDIEGSFNFTGRNLVEFSGSFSIRLP